MKNKFKNEEELKRVIVKRVEEKLGFKVVKIRRLRGGINNICYLVALADGTKLLAKKYYQDDQKRLEREFEAVSYFSELKLFAVPRPYFADKKLYLAVYSFIDGEIKGAKKIGKKEILDLVDYAVKLHSIQPTVASRAKIQLTAIRPAFALVGHLNNLKFKMERFKKYYAGLPDANELKIKVEKGNFLERLDAIVGKILRGISEKDLNEVLAWSQRRINHIDFGFHNVIYKTSGSREKPYFIDYELSGWDDPARMIGDFMTHDKNREISLDLREFFLKEYKKAGGLGPKEKNRLDRAVALMDAEWVATYFWSIAPERLAIRELAIKDFRPRNFIVKQLRKIEERLAGLEAR